MPAFKHLTVLLFALAGTNVQANSWSAATKGSAQKVCITQHNSDGKAEDATIGYYDENKNAYTCTINSIKSGETKCCRPSIEAGTSCDILDEYKKKHFILAKSGDSVKPTEIVFEDDNGSKYWRSRKFKSPNFDNKCGQNNDVCGNSGDLKGLQARSCVAVRGQNGVAVINRYVGSTCQYHYGVFEMKDTGTRTICPSRRNLRAATPAAKEDEERSLPVAPASNIDAEADKERKLDVICEWCPDLITPVKGDGVQFRIKHVQSGDWLDMDRNSWETSYKSEMEGSDRKWTWSSSGKLKNIKYSKNMFVAGKQEEVVFPRSNECGNCYHKIKYEADGQTWALYRRDGDLSSSTGAGDDFELVAV